MGYYIRCNEIYEYYDLVKSWYGRMSAILDDLEKKLTSLSGTQNMKGESAEGIKNYSKQFYLRIIPGIRVVLESLESKLRHYKEEYRINIDGAEDAVFCEDAFTEYIAEMEKQMNSIGYFHEQIEMIIRNVDFANIRKPGVYSFEEVNRGLTRTIQSLAEDVAAMESQHVNDTQNAEELAEALIEFMQSACFQPLQQSISATVEQILESEDLGKLDLSIAYMQEKVRQDNLQERMEDCSEEYFEWLKIAEGFEAQPYVCEEDSDDAKVAGTVSIGYGFSFNREGNHWEILKEVLGWSDKDIMTIINAAYDPNDDSEYQYTITEEQACILFEKVKEEYIQKVNDAISYYNQQHNCTVGFTQSELEAMFDYAYNNGMAPSYVEDSGRIIYYYFRGDLAGAVDAMIKYESDKRRRLNQVYLFFYGYAFTDDLDLLRNELGFYE